MRFRIRIRRVMDSPLPVRIQLMEQQFETKPTVAKAIRVSEMYRDNDIPVRKWSPIALFGEYMHFYSQSDQAFLNREFTVKCSYQSIKNLVQKNGVTETYWAIQAIWKLDWVKTGKMNFLTSVVNYEKYVMPKIMELRNERKKARGEQAEWSGPMSDRIVSSVTQVVL